MHALYLAQPFLQFVALMAVLFVLGRCSPLAPSTDKSVQKTFSDGVKTTRSETGENRAEGEDLKNSMLEIQGVPELEVISPKMLQRRLKPDSLDADEGADLAKIQNLANLKRARKPVRLLFVRLTTAEREAFFATGSLQVVLHKRLGRMSEELRKAYLHELHIINRQELTGKLYALLPDEEMDKPDSVASLHIGTKARLAITPDESRAALALERTVETVDEEQQKRIDFVKSHAVGMVLTLE